MHFPVIKKLQILKFLLIVKGYTLEDKALTSQRIVEVFIPEVNC